MAASCVLADVIVCNNGHKCELLTRRPPSYMGTTLCDECRVSIAVLSGFHHCAICKFDLCGKCRALPKYNKKLVVNSPGLSAGFGSVAASGLGPSIFSEIVAENMLPMTYCKKHNHRMSLLHAQPSEYRGSVQCDHCRGPISVRMGFRHCQSCEFDLCAGCCQHSIYNGQISSPAPASPVSQVIHCRNNHTMPLMHEKPAEYLLPNIICDECRSRLVPASGYHHCSICAFDLCLICSRIASYHEPPVQAVCTNHHDMVLLTKKPADVSMFAVFRCSHCTKSIQSKKGFHYCASCKMALCAICAGLPLFSRTRILSLAMIESYCPASHVMKYLTSTPELYVGNRIVCDHCLSAISVATGFTHCGECHFDLCINCFKLPQYAVSGEAHDHFRPSEAAALPGASAYYCDQGHVLECLYHFPSTYKNQDGLNATLDCVVCNICSQEVLYFDDGFHHCSICSFDICHGCSTSGAVGGGEDAMEPDFDASVEECAEEFGYLFTPGCPNCNRHFEHLYIQPLQYKNRGTPITTGDDTDDSKWRCVRCRQEIIVENGVRHCGYCSYDICDSCYAPISSDEEC
jgi:hypothetical protein